MPDVLVTDEDLQDIRNAAKILGDKATMSLPCSQIKSIVQELIKIRLRDKELSSKIQSSKMNAIRNHVKELEKLTN